MNSSAYITDLAARGRYHFTTSQFARSRGLTATAARAALRRLRQKGAIASPYRGFHVIVPPEYRRLGCLPADQFIGQLMAELDLVYYVGLLSAARHHGAAHQQPQVFQVMVAKNRPPLACGLVRTLFTARKNIAAIPTLPFNTPRGTIAVSSPEATTLDLIGYANHAGGLNNVAGVVSELAEILKPDELVRAARFSPVPWAQRLGFILAMTGADGLASALADLVARAPRKTAILDPASPNSGADFDPIWKLRINVPLELD